MSNHSPEPWSTYPEMDKRHRYLPIMSARSANSLDGGADDAVLVATVVNHHVTWDVVEANADRIISCVNSLAGVVDPLTFIPEMRAALRVQTELLGSLMRDASPNPDEEYKGMSDFEIAVSPAVRALLGLG